MADLDEAVLKRVLPHSIEAEQSVIGAMLMDADAITVASEQITGEDFYGSLFDAMVELHNEGKPVDLVTLRNRLQEKNVPPEIYSLEYIRDIMTAVPTSANVKYYANIVWEKSILRRLVHVNEDIANSCYSQKESFETLLEETEKKVFEMVMNARSMIEKAS